MNYHNFETSGNFDETLYTALVLCMTMLFSILLLIYTLQYIFVFHYSSLVKYL